jgi:hypothetical protein
MTVPQRIQDYDGRYALVDGIPFHLPVNCDQSPVLMAVFSIDADKARALIPGNEIHPFRLWNRGLLVITVVDYIVTDIGKYIEFSIAIACTHGRKPAPRLLPAVFRNHYGFGQYVYDLPVSSEISVKGGKGIWGMPKHQANLDYVVGERTVSSQYDLDGQLAMKIEIERPKSAWLPMNTAAANYSAFRGLLVKSYIHFKGRMGMSLMKKGAGRLTLGTHPRVQALKGLDIDPDPFCTLFIPSAHGILDDYFESWFLTFDELPAQAPEGFESVGKLGLGQGWLAPPVPRPQSAAEPVRQP